MSLSHTHSALRSTKPRTSLTGVRTGARTSTRSPTTRSDSVRFRWGLRTTVNAMRRPRHSMASATGGGGGRSLRGRAMACFIAPV